MKRTHSHKPADQLPVLWCCHPLGPVPNDEEARRAYSPHIAKLYSRHICIWTRCAEVALLMGNLGTTTHMICMPFIKDISYDSNNKKRWVDFAHKHTFKMFGDAHNSVCVFRFAAWKWAMMGDDTELHAHKCFACKYVNELCKIRKAVSSRPIDKAWEYLVAVDRNVYYRTYVYCYGPTIFSAWSMKVLYLIADN